MGARSRRIDLGAILADPEKRRRLLTGATAFLIGVGSDFELPYAEARLRAEQVDSGYQSGPSPSL